MAKKLSDNPVNVAWIDGIIHSLPLGVHLYELREDQLILTGANKAADEILGLRHRKLFGKTLELAFPPLAYTEIPVRYKEVAVSGKAYEDEQVNYEDKEISGAFQVYAVQILPGRIAVMFRDITEKKKADEALRISEEKLRRYNEELEITKQKLDKSLQSLASVNKSLIEMQVDLENKNEDLKDKNEEFSRLNQEYETQNEQLKKTNIRLEETNARIIEISGDIRNSEQQLRIILENSKDIIYSINYSSGNIEYISPVVREILGLPESAFLHQSPDNLFNRMHPDDIPKYGKHWQDIIELEEKEIFLFEIGYRLQDIDGNYHWISENNKLLKDEGGRPLYLIGSIRDITDQKKSDIALKSSEKNFMQLADNIMDIFWLLEGKKLLYVSSSFEKVTGINREKVMQNPESILATIHPDDKKSLSFFNDLKTIENEGFMADQFRILKPDGSIRWIWSRTFPVYNSEGKLYRIAGIASDITLQKDLESELRTAKDKAQESDRLKSTFLANISHEIRTPMNGIIGFAGLLVRTATNDESRNRYLEIINKSSDQLLHIIDDIIDISKIEANQVQVVYSPCNINELLDEIHIFYFRELIKAEKNQVELIPSYSLTNENSGIITDGLRLRQIMGNLMSNAIKFTERGTIRFGYEMEEKDHIRFFVEDSGIGIDPSKSEIIFQPFRQADEGDARKFGGTGLGLPISLGFVKMLQGRMWYESTPGKGTSVYFSLPFRPAVTHEHTEVLSLEKIDPVWKDKRILIVEDDELNFEYLNAILEPTSILIEHAYDGVQAVIMCKKEKFDVVLMDIRIPKLDGLQATRKIREFRLTVPVIAQTAFAMANDRDKCLDAGCNDYISKPINKDSLIEVLSKYLDNNP